MARRKRRDCRTGERKRTADVQRRDQQIRSIRKGHKQQQQQQPSQQQASAPEAAGTRSHAAAAAAQLRAQIARSMNIPAPAAAGKPAAAPKGGGT